MGRGDHDLLKYCNLFGRISFLQNFEQEEEMSVALQFQNEAVITALNTEFYCFYSDPLWTQI